MGIFYGALLWLGSVDVVDTAAATAFCPAVFQVDTSLVVIGRQPQHTRQRVIGWVWTNMLIFDWSLSAFDV